MANIIDRRETNRNKSSINREKFVSKHKKRFRKSLHDKLRNKSIKDIEKGEDRSIDVEDISEPTFTYDRSTGKPTHIVTENSEGKRRKDIVVHDNSGSGGGAGNGESDDEEFSFELTKKEYVDLLFDELELPNFVKEGLAVETNKKLMRAGYSKEGIPARLDLLKTMEAALSRRIANKNNKKKPRFLDDEDLRYKFFDLKENKIKRATMICVMDVSGSVTDEIKQMSRKFFILLYSFLKKSYDDVQLRFVIHHSKGMEVNEQQFFGTSESGGTAVSSGLEVVQKIIDKDIDLNTTNVYVAQTSDGDNWGGDNERCYNILNNYMLPCVQYYAYVELFQGRRVADLQLYRMFKDLNKSHDNLGIVRTEVGNPSFIIEALYKLFKKK